MAAAVQRHRELGVERHNAVVEVDIGPVEGRRTVLVEHHIALAGVPRIAPEEEPHKAAADTALEAGCIAAGDMGCVKEHRRAVEAEDNLEAADCGSLGIGHTLERAKNHNLAGAAGVEEDIADNLLHDS